MKHPKCGPDSEVLHSVSHFTGASAHCHFGSFILFLKHQSQAVFLYIYIIHIYMKYRQQRSNYPNKGTRPFSQLPQGCYWNWANLKTHAHTHVQRSTCQMDCHHHNVCLQTSPKVPVDCWNYSPFQSPLISLLRGNANKLLSEPNCY